MSDAPLPFDDTILQTYLQNQLADFDCVKKITKFDSGQSNPTFLLTSSHAKYVLRKKPPGTLLKSAHAIEREFLVQQALYTSDVPVPKMYHLCEDNSIIGTPFYIMEHIYGVTYQDPQLEKIPQNTRHQIQTNMAHVLAAIHSIDINIAGLAQFGPPGNYLERQISRWVKQYYACETGILEDMNALIKYLENNIPEDDGMRTLVHGDYRLDNMIFDTKSHECLAVLDWELSTLGHPFADLAGVIMQWQMPTGSIGRGLQGINRPEHGLLRDDEFIALYCQKRGIHSISNFEFYVAFCFFRMAAILQGVKKRALDGNASNPEKGLQLGAHIPFLAKMGLEYIQKK